MKKSNLIKIIKGSIKELMNEQPNPNPNPNQPNPQWVQTFTQTILNRHSNGKGCQFLCNRLSHLVNKYNAQTQTGNYPSGFGNHPFGQQLGGKISWVANYAGNYNNNICLELGQYQCGLQSGGCGCPSPSVME